jgi:hypothetical protein
MRIDRRMVDDAAKMSSMRPALTLYTFSARYD